MLEFTFDYPALQTGYGVNLSSLAATEALRNGYTVYDSITIAPNKKLEDADIPKGSLLCSYNQGSGIGELYLDMDRYVTIHKNYFSLEILQKYCHRLVKRFLASYFYKCFWFNICKNRPGFD